jgi:hypothetical protein
MAMTCGGKSNRFTPQSVEKGISDSSSEVVGREAADFRGQNYIVLGSLIDEECFEGIETLFEERWGADTSSEQHSHMPVISLTDLGSIPPNFRSPSYT